MGHLFTYLGIKLPLQELILKKYREQFPLEIFDFEFSHSLGQYRTLSLFFDPNISSSREELDSFI
jgi:hypothetical protein